MVWVDAILVDYRQQTFNDALYSLEQAKKLDKNKILFEYWKYCTWSIISATICMESYLVSHVKTIREDMEDSLWKSYNKEACRIAKSRGIYSRITFVELITDYKIIDMQDLSWKNIADIIHIRNNMIHFNEDTIFNSMTETNAENAIKACRDLVKKFHIAIGTDYKKFAPWIDKTQSENYDNPKNNMYNQIP